MNQQIEFKDGDPVLLDGEDYYKLNQYDIYPKEPEINFTQPRVNLGSFEQEQRIGIASGTKVQTPDGKFHIVGGKFTFSNEKKAYLSEKIIITNKTNNGVSYRGTDKYIPVFDKNGKLIVKIIIE